MRDNGCLVLLPPSLARHKDTAYRKADSEFIMGIVAIDLSEVIEIWNLSLRYVGKRVLSKIRHWIDVAQITPIICFRAGL